MVVAHFRVLIHELMNKYPDIFPKENHLIILYSKSDVCVAKYGKDNKHTRHISRRVHFVRIGEKFKIHKIDWCEGGLQLADIVTNNVGENELNHRNEYIMLRLDN